MSDTAVKINEEIITLKPEIVEKLTLSDDSFFRGAIDFYKNNSNSERKPIDLTSAPCAHRFNDLIKFLEPESSFNLTLCDYTNADEILKLSEYLGISPYNTLDKLAHKGRLKIKSLRQKERQYVLDMALKVINALVEKEIRHFVFYKKANIVYLRLNIPNEVNNLFSYDFRYSPFHTVMIKLKELLNPRLKYMMYAPDWRGYTGSHDTRLELYLKPLEDFNEVDD